METLKMIENVVEIPPSALSEGLLQAIIEEFVSRDGTDYGLIELDLDEKVQNVMDQLYRQEVIIQFDQRTESVNIVKK